MAVLIERAVMERRRPIAYVYRDLDDDGFQFISDGEKTEADAMMVSLEEVYELDPAIGELADLPPGWRAVRESRGGEWVVEPCDPEVRSPSAVALTRVCLLSHHSRGRRRRSPATSRGGSR